MSKHLARGIRASVYSLTANSVLAVVKLVAGLLGNSYALVADAVESMGDIVSSGIVWGGLKIAAIPPDKDHPYGHGKAESLAALAVAIMLVAAAVGLAVQAVREILHPQVGPALFTLPVLVGVVLVKEGLFRFLWKQGTQARSTAVKTDAWHHRGDALTSLAAAIGISIALLGGPGYEAADDWAALLACGVIAANGFRLMRPAVRDLMDERPVEGIEQAVGEAAAGVPGVERVEKLFARKSGPSFLVDMHIEVAGDLSVRDAHALAHRVKDVVRERFPEVVDVLIHVEPAEESGGKPAEPLASREA